MGKVYSPEEIWNDQIPHPDTHQQTATELMGALEDVPSLYAATLYGSTALGNPNTRSDIDVAVVHEETADKLDFYEQLLKKTAQLRYGNLIEFHVNSSRELTSLDAAKETDAFMVEHLRLMAQTSVVPGIHTEAFETMVHPFKDLPATEGAELAEVIFRRYLMHKERRFFEAQRRHTDEINYARIQRAFELPTAITRKLVRLQQLRACKMSSIVELPPHFYQRDGLASHAKTYYDASPEWAECSTWLIARDGEYTELLNDTVAGSTSLKEYEAWLHDIARPSYQKALHLSIATEALYQTVKLR